MRPQHHSLARRPGLLWLSPLSDLTVALAHYKIPTALLSFAFRRATAPPDPGLTRPGGPGTVSRADNPFGG